MSCIGQILSFHVLAKLNHFLSCVCLVLAKLDHFLSWTELISYCLGQNRSVLVLDRITQLFSWTDSIMSCLCHTRSVLGQIRSILVLGRFSQFLENSFLSLPDSISLEQISSCLCAIRSVLGKLIIVFARFNQFLANQTRSVIDKSVPVFARFDQFLCLLDLIISCLCQTIYYQVVSWPALRSGLVFAKPDKDLRVCQRDHFLPALPDRIDQIVP